MATAVSLFTAVGPTQVAQNSRSALTLDILACDENSPTAEGQLDWPDNPTRLSLGDGLTQYDMGAVVGNWVLVVSVAGVLMGLSKKIKLRTSAFSWDNDIAGYVFNHSYDNVCDDFTS